MDMYMYMYMYMFMYQVRFKHMLIVMSKKVKEDSARCKTDKVQV